MPTDVDRLLDCPADEVPNDSEFLQAAIRWHFDPETGSPFWLRRARTLDFDPLEDVHSFEDLSLFPNVVNELRDVPVRDLIPRGYGGRAEVVGVFESGGTTGTPKRLLLLGDWQERFIGWVSRYLDRRGFPTGVDYLVVGPTGPHMMGHMGAELARRRGGMPFHIDFDPRWAQECGTSGDERLAARYADHLVAQAEPILRTQEIGVMVITPPLLERMARSETLVELMNRRVKAIFTAGARMDEDTWHLLRTEILPGVDIHVSYGSTMGMSPAVNRLGLDEDSPEICDTFSPYVTFRVVDPETGRPVEYGERGQVVMNHVSKSLFLPNNAERDLGVRVEPPPGQVGDSVSDVRPMPEFGGERVVEGVY